MNKKLIIIVGPTASGKTAYAMDIARKSNTEIVSADSRQLYKGLYIGTAQPTYEERQMVKHHLIDCVDISYLYTVADFVRDASKIINELFKTHDDVVMVGGTGLYISAFANGLNIIPNVDPEIRTYIVQQHNMYGLEWCQQKLKQLDEDCDQYIDMHNTLRVMRALEILTQTGKPLRSFFKQQNIERDYDIEIIGILRDRNELYQRINTRVDIMVEAGLVEEVKKLIPYRNTCKALTSIGYKEIFSYLDDNCTLDKAIDNIKLNTRHYAKRQMTWFNNKLDVNWLKL